MCGIVISTALVETLSISYILPVSECDMNLSTTQKGIITAVGFVGLKKNCYRALVKLHSYFFSYAGIISSSHLWGFLADTKGRRTVIVPTLLSAFGCTVLSSLAPNFWVFVVLRFLNGFL